MNCKCGACLDCLRVERGGKPAYEELVRALQFYADPKSWERDGVDIGVGEMDIPGSSQAELDAGQIAAQVLGQ